MSTVLLVGQDEILQFTRAALLRTLGVETVCADGQAALKIQQDRKCDLVILCHSLPARLAASLTEKIHICWPNTRVLRVAAQEWEVIDNAASGDVVTSGDPESFILQAKKLLPAGHGASRVSWHRRKLFA